MRSRGCTDINDCDEQVQTILSQKSPIGPGALKWLDAYVKQRLSVASVGTQKRVQLVRMSDAVADRILERLQSIDEGGSDE